MSVLPNSLTPAERTLCHEHKMQSKKLRNNGLNDDMRTKDYMFSYRSILSDLKPKLDRWTLQQGQS